MGIRYEQTGAGVTLTGHDSFDVGQTLECGQVFRYERLNGRSYRLLALRRVLDIEHRADSIIFTPCTTDEFEDIWINYFDLRTDYAAIKRALSKGDDVMQRAAAFGAGIRILNQDKWEMLVSFIISQHNRIPAIQRTVDALAAAYGEPIGQGAFTFPDAARLAGITEADLAGLKTGFRAKYIADAVRKVNNGELDLEGIDAIGTDEMMQQLMTVKGVGPKVAACVALFAYGRRESFPVDVWVERAMRRLYFDDKPASTSEIRQFAEKRFGAYGGYAQQYLFHYIRHVK